MKKSSEFISAFSDLNDQIVSAIAERNFSRLILLDKARQDMMQGLLLLSSDEIDDELFEFIEFCSQENTRMIRGLENEIEKLTFQNNRFVKAANAYQN